VAAEVTGVDESEVPAADVPAEAADVPAADVPAEVNTMVPALVAAALVAAALVAAALVAAALVAAALVAAALVATPLALVTAADVGALVAAALVAAALVAVPEPTGRGRENMLAIKTSLLLKMVLVGETEKSLIASLSPTKRMSPEPRGFLRRVVFPVESTARETVPATAVNALPNPYPV